MTLIIMLYDEINWLIYSSFHILSLRIITSSDNNVQETHWTVFYSLCNIWWFIAGGRLIIKMASY